MARSRRDHLANRTYVESVDSQDLRSVISAALDARPLDEDSLRRGVWTYVDAERNAGASPARVIVALTELVERAEIAPMAARHSLMRRVLLWCVEAYFGHLGGHVVGDITGPQGEASVDEPMLVSNR